MKQLKYEAVYTCLQCNDMLTSHEYLTSHGVCPRCGHVNGNNYFCQATKTSKEVEVKRQWHPIWFALWVTAFIVCAIYTVTDLLLFTFLYP